MEKLWTIPELMERYGWAEITAIRKAQKEMRHIGKGKKTRVPESTLQEWEQKQEQDAGNEIRQATKGEHKKKEKKSPKLKVITGGKQSNFAIPRTRDEALKMLGYG